MKYIKALGLVFLFGCQAPEARPTLRKNGYASALPTPENDTQDPTGFGNSDQIAHATALTDACTSTLSNPKAIALKTSLKLISDRYSIKDCVALGQFLVTTSTLDVAGLGMEDISFLKETSQLTKINFNDNRISDLSALTELKNLKFLEIARNNLSSLEGLGALTQLKELGLQENQITDMSELSGLTGIEVLQIAENQLTAMEPVSSMTSLRTLSIHTNNIGDLSPIKGLRNLEILNLQQNLAAIDFSALAGLSKLRVLDVSSSLVNDISFIANLKALQQLHLSTGSIESYAPIAKLSSLLSFTIDNADSFVSTGAPFNPNCLTNSTGIQELNLIQQNILSLDFLKPFKNLKAVTLDRNPILSSGMNELKYHPELVQISCSECALTDLDFVEGLAKIESIKVSGNGIFDISGLRTAVQLKALDLGFNLDVTDITPLANTKNLETVILSNNSITDITPLKTAVKMKTLDISSNLLTDIRPLADMIQLVGLRMGRNSIRSLTSLNRLVKLVDLNADGTLGLVSGDIPVLSGIKFLSVRESELTTCDFARLLPNLIQIDLGVNKLTSIECLRGLTNLTKVNYQTNTVIDMTPISTLTALVDLNASDNGIRSVAALGSLFNLETLSLSENTRIVDMNPIKALKSLRSLVTLYSNEKPAPIWSKTGCPTGTGVNAAVADFCNTILASQGKK